jgi:DNA/RNA-binding domain of Phe-tRNA-synthetase-like protein
VTITAPSRYETIRFEVAPEVSARGIKVLVLAMTGLRNRENDPEFEEIKAQSIQKIVATTDNASLQQDPILKGFRDLHSTLGFSNRNFPAASESLLEYALKYQRLPQVNLLVDIYNLVSLETRLSLGAHDLAKVNGDIRLAMTTGSEGFQPLGAEQNKPVRPGAYAYIDGDDDVICLMEVKQVEKTKTGLETSDCFYILQGNAQTPDETLLGAARRLIELNQRFLGGQARFL